MDVSVQFWFAPIYSQNVFWDPWAFQVNQGSIWSKTGLIPALPLIHYVASLTSQSILHAAVKTPLPCPSIWSCHFVLCILHWLPICYHNIFKLLVLTFKVLQNSAPNTYLLIPLPHQHSCLHQPAGQFLAQLPLCLFPHGPLCMIQPLISSAKPLTCPCLSPLKSHFCCAAYDESSWLV